MTVLYMPNSLTLPVQEPHACSCTGTDPSSQHSGCQALQSHAGEEELTSSANWSCMFCSCCTAFATESFSAFILRAKIDSSTFKCTMTTAKWGLSTAHSRAALPKYTVTANALTSRAKLSARNTLQWGLQLKLSGLKEHSRGLTEQDFVTEQIPAQIWRCLNDAAADATLSGPVPGSAS